MSGISSIEGHTLRGLVVAVLLCASGAARADDAGAENTKQLCSDGEDNDGDGLVDCADPDCQAFRMCAAYVPAPGAVVGDCPEPAKVSRPIQSAAKTALGAVFIPVGLIMVAGSIPLYLGINYSTDTYSGRLPDGSMFTTKIGFGYQCSASVPCDSTASEAHAHDIPYLVGGLILTVAGVTATSIGGWLLYTGLQPKKLRSRPRPVEEGFIPTMGFDAHGATVGLGGSF